MKAALAVLLLSTLPVMASPAAPGPVRAFTHVTVIDCTGAKPKKDQTVVLQDGKILRIGRTGNTRVPSGAEELNAEGKFLIPGLWEMHAHVTGNRGFSELYVANGVTGIRDMGSSLASIQREREAIAGGLRVGPCIIAAGPILDTGGGGPISEAVVTNSGAQEAVRRLKQGGSDFIKIGTMLPPHLYHALADEAKAQGLPFAGHVPLAVSAREASDTGQRSIEHLMGLSIASSSREAELLQRSQVALGKMAEAFRDREHPNMELFGQQMQELFNRVPTDAEASYSPEKAAALFKRFAKNGTWHCPTLVALDHIARLDQPGFFEDERNKYLMPELRAFWNPKADPRFQNNTAESYAAQRALFQKHLERVRQMHRAGVQFLAGSDVMNPRIYPGFSLHEELEFLTRAGFSPLEALQTATRNPARYLKLQKELGTVEAGKSADLVLLDADPLADIRNTTRIRAVVVRGQLLDRQQLDEILATVAAEANPAPK